MSLRTWPAVLVHSQVWIAIVAAAASWSTLQLVCPAAEWGRMVWWILLATLSVYGFHRLIGLQRAGEQLTRLERYRFVRSYPQLSRGLYSAAALLAVVWWLVDPIRVPLWLLLGAVGLVSAYEVPRLKDGFSGLRRSGFKPVAIAVCWALVTAVWPAWVVAPSADWAVYTWVFGERFGLSLMVAFCFDWRDRELDRQQGIYNPAARSLRSCRIFGAMALLVAAASVASGVVMSVFSPAAGMAILLSHSVAAVALWQLDSARSDLDFGFWYNGLLAVGAVLILII